LKGVPAYDALNAGQPERVGLAYGWDEAKMLAASRTQLPDGTPYENLCIGCDRFHEQVLGPVIEEAKARRRAARGEPPLPAATRKTIALKQAG